MSTAIVITSGKGGVGKTTITAALGAHLAALDKRVALMDADIGLNNLDVVLGLESSVVYDLVDVIEGRCRLKQALIRHDSGVDVLPSCHSYDRSKINGQNIRAVVNSLKTNHDFVLIDCPAGIEAGFHRAVAAADEALIVVTPHVSSIRDADRTISILRSYHPENTRIIVNRARGDLMADAEIMDIKDIEVLCRDGLAGVIPEDDRIALEQSLGTVPSGETESSKAFRILAKNIITNDSVIYDVTARYRGFLGGLRRRFKRLG